MGGIEKTMGSYDIGLIGLAVMGENLALNIERNGSKVAVYNRTGSKTNEFIKSLAQGKNIRGFLKLEEFVKNIKSPRKIILMVKAGKPVDGLIAELVPLLNKKDILIDGKQITIEAESEILLKCGKGSILIRKDGKIILKGTDLLSRSSGRQRIKGSSVSIN